MKKHLLAIASVAMIAGAISFSSCKKDDTTPPTITVSGGNSARTQSLPAIAGQGTWTNPSATANDDKDGDISSKITVSGTVDPNTEGTYTLTYSVSDAAGNTATQSITVNIVNDADFLNGAYGAHDTCQVTAPFNYNPTVNVSTTVNNALVINNFGAFGTGININGTLSGSNITIPSSQTLGGSSSIVSASGAIISATAPVKFSVNYTWTDGTNTEVCISMYTHN